MKIRIINLLFIFLIINACNGKVPGADARKIPPNAKDRIQKNMDEGRGFTLMGSAEKNTGEFDFASSNELWRASLDTLDFMPLALANYSGGIIVTDWYSDGSSDNESVKISIRFLTNEIRSDALIVKVFYKNCSMQDNCKVSDRSDELSSELAKKILTKAAVYEKDTFSKKKKKYRNEALRTDEQDQ
jgi:hypothetical protein|tara:strand:- start:719 stop:1279 length:561 start_codon:yes stop_codon:yes gene_type:complete